MIENNTRRIKILEEMAQRIYREWFIRFRFPDHGNVPLVPSDLGPIPQGWTVRRVSSLVKPQYGYTASAASEPVGPKYLRGMDINKSSFVDWSTVPYCAINATKASSFRLSVGDVVVIRMADPGKVGIVEQEVDAVFASYLVRLQIRENCISPYCLFLFLRDNRYQGYITGASTGQPERALVRRQ